MTARPGVRAWLLGSLLLLLAATGVAADPGRSFKKGMSAADLGKWHEAVDWLSKAIEEDPQESDKRILMTGIFTHPYLPHFYLGWAQAKIGDSRCGLALAAFAESERQGVVLELSRQLAELREAKAHCLAVLLPAAERRALAAVGEAAAKSESLQSPLSMPSLETERLAAIAELEKARQSLSAGRDRRSLGDLKTAEDLAKQAEARFQALLARVASNAPGGGNAGDLEAAAARARQAVAGAEAAERGLATWLGDPSHADIRRQYPELAMPEGVRRRLQAVRDQLRRSASMAAYRRVEEDAAGIATEIGQVERLAQSLSAVMARQARQSAAGVLEPPPESLGAGVAIRDAPSRDAPSRDAPSRDAPSRDAPSLQPEIDAGLEPRLQQLVDESLALLAEVDSASPSRLVSLQHHRLGELVAEARGAVDGSPEIATRLASSFTALQLAAGAQALFDGRAGEAEQILSARALPSSRLGARGLLLRAAARFALSRLESGDAGAMSRQAERDIRRCRSLDAEAKPEPSYFSAAFRQLFAATNAGSGGS